MYYTCCTYWFWIDWLPPCKTTISYISSLPKLPHDRVISIRLLLDNVDPLHYEQKTWDKKHFNLSLWSCLAGPVSAGVWLPRPDGSSALLARTVQLKPVLHRGRRASPLRAAASHSAGALSSTADMSSQVTVHTFFSIVSSKFKEYSGVSLQYVESLYHSAFVSFSTYVYVFINLDKNLFLKGL